MNPSIHSLRIAVLAGGDSDERPISLKSGAAVEAALSQFGHRALHLDPAIVELRGVDWSQFDVAFIALHGRFGEDGQVQQLLDDAGMRYTGSSAAASRLAFSKSAAKERFLQSGVPTPAYALIHYTDDFDRIQQQAETVGYPLVVKPDTQGSSLGISIVRKREQLSGALKRCFEFDGFGLIEAMIEGTEWTVGFIDSQTLPAIKIETDREFFDWQAKYDDDATRYIFDAKLPMPVIERIESAARDACRSLGTSGLMRVDLRVDDAQQPWVLEINTIPGFTDHSLLPKAAARMGISFPQLCDQVVQSVMGHQPPQPHILQAVRVRRAAS
ncbi:D-alanine--D-alanine ligase family protein [Schlesneria paludicola]|uniref:D-alanine--D-alanine ligase family protein n=1 Tax=Schlesneria paludicola TaxID=360056 RepID=UPI00029A29F4|nr:D-alanine--D-alanine ligase [Schlesneria paludicola]